MKIYQHNSITNILTACLAFIRILLFLAIYRNVCRNTNIPVSKICHALDVLDTFVPNLKKCYSPILTLKLKDKFTCVWPLSKRVWRNMKCHFILYRNELLAQFCIVCDITKITVFLKWATFYWSGKFCIFNII